MKDCKDSKESLKTYGEKPNSFEFDNNEKYYIGSEVCLFLLLLISKV
jgi:hypothetical protein